MKRGGGGSKLKKIPPYPLPLGHKVSKFPSFSNDIFHDLVTGQVIIRFWKWDFVISSDYFLKKIVCVNFLGIIIIHVQNKQKLCHNKCNKMFWRLQPLCMGKQEEKKKKQEKCAFQNFPFILHLHPVIIYSAKFILFTDSKMKPAIFFLLGKEREYFTK